MTIEELLESARGYCHLADREMERDRGSLDKAAQYAAIAQACAQTAQATMLAQMLAQMKVTGESAIAGEMVRWLRVDASY